LPPEPEAAGDFANRSTASIWGTPNGMGTASARSIPESAGSGVSALLKGAFERQGTGACFETRATPAALRVRPQMRRFPNDRRLAAGRAGKPVRTGFGRKVRVFRRLSGLARGAGGGSPEGRAIGFGHPRTGRVRDGGEASACRLQTGWDAGGRFGERRRPGGTVRASARTEPPQGIGWRLGAAQTRKPATGRATRPTASHPPSGTPRRQAGHGAGTVGAGGNTGPHHGFGSKWYLEPVGNGLHLLLPLLRP
jgi:hypothetical protein